MAFLLVGGAPARAAFVHVRGDAGEGKTRLLQALRSRLEEQHEVQWLYCPTSELLRQSLHPFVYALRRVFDQSSERTPEENRAAFERARTRILRHLPKGGLADSVRKELERTASMLAALLDLHWENSLYEQLEPQLRFENTLLALVNLVKALSFRSPVVLEVDGGHLLDGDSRTLLGRMVMDLASWPVAVLVASRETAREGVALPGADANVWQEMRLQPLSQEDTRAAATALLGRELTDKAAHLLYERSGGNPLFLEQLIQYLRELAAFVPAVDPPGALDLAKPDLADVPVTVDAMLIARLDRLASPVREVVQTAAILGREFDIPVLAHMVSDPESLPDLVHAAEAAGIWRTGDETHYVFSQALLRDVAYHMQMGERRRRLHRLAGEAYEQVHEGDRAPYYADMAYHFEQGEDASKAAVYLRKAGDQARLNYQNEMALSFYERLLTYADEETRVQVHEYRGDINHRLGAYGQALEAYSSALEIWLRREGSERHVANVDRKIAGIHVDKGEYNVALDWLDRAQQRLRQQDCPERAQVLLLAAGIAYRQGRIERALDQCQTALEVASRVDAAPEQAHAYRLLGTIHTGAGDLQAAVEDYQTSLELCHHLNDLRQESMTSNSLAAVYYYLGDLNKAEEMYLQSLEVATRIGFVDQQATVANNLGELYLLQGRFEEAEVQFQRCLRTWQHTGFLLGVALSWRNLAQIAANREQWQMALTDLQESLRVLDRLDSRGWVRAEAYRLLAEVEEAQGHREAAWEHIHRALAIVNEQNIRLVESNVYRTLGILHRGEGQDEKAEAALKQSIELAQRLGLRYEEGKAWAELAALYRRWGTTGMKKAAEAREKARTILADLGARWDLARVE